MPTPKHPDEQLPEWLKRKQEKEAAAAAATSEEPIAFNEETPQELPQSAAAEFLAEALAARIKSQSANPQAIALEGATVFEAMSHNKEYVKQASATIQAEEDNVVFNKLQDRLRQMALYYSLGFEAGRAYERKQQSIGVKNPEPNGPQLVR